MVSNPNIVIGLRDIVGGAILQQRTCVVLNQEATQDEVRKAIRIFMRKHPEIFWFSHQYRFDESSSTLYLKYNFIPKKKDFFSKEIDNSVSFLFQPDRLKNLSELEKVTYVYKWIVNNTTYNEYSSFNQTIYSVLINRNSVCTGYAKTAQYLLSILGIESELVFGKFHADKSDGGRHGWNIVKIDDDWYHVDFCLADPSLKHLLNKDESPIEFDGLLWNYFCKPTEYILRNRSIEFLEQYPDCNKEILKRFKIALAKPLRQLAVCKSDSGSTAKVYLDSFNKNQVIKISRHDSSLIENEYRILNQLDGCKHVNQLIDHKDNGLVLEQLTSWSELLNSHYYHPNEEQLKNILIQLAEGLKECKEKGVTYSDIHYNNVFVTKNGLYKWGDFGIAYPSTLDGEMPLNMLGDDGIAIGSRWFMAPETYRDGIFTESSAIYSLAMLAYFVMNDMRPPFWDNKKEEVEVFKNIHNSNIEIPTPKLGYNELWEFLKGTCLCKDFNNRLLYLSDFRDALKCGLLYSNCHQILLALKRNHLKAKLASGGKITLKASGDLFDKTVDKPINIALPKGKLIGDEHLIDSNILNGEENPDLDSFATTDSQPTWSSIDNQNWVDTDSYAQTCSFTPAPVPPATSQLSERIPVHQPHTALTPTSFHPTKGEVKSNKQPHRKKFGFGSLIQSALSSVSEVLYDILVDRVAVCACNSSYVEDEISTDLDNHTEETDDISTCLYAPSEVIPNKSFIIRVYMYLPNEQDVIDSKIKEIDPTAVKKEYKPLDIPVKNGDKLSVQLDLSDGVECKNTSKTVTWRGHYTDCSFIAKLIDANQDSIEGTAYVLVNDVPAGEMLFTIDVVETKPRELYTRVESHRFSKIFISYAHQDESQVRGIAEGCKMLGKDYFFDRHSLQAGDIFKDKILDYINDADLFVLCWSKNAAESEWVQIEREHALRLIREGKSSLSIYPLCLRPEAPLPIDMSGKYNFGTL